MLRLLTTLLLSAFLVMDCFSATITGTAKDSKGNALVTLIYFTPTPVFPRSANPAVITTDTVKAQTASDGTFSVSLVTGSYVVTIAGKDRFTIYVPDSSSSYNWTTIQTSTNLYGVTDTAWLLKSGGIMSGHIAFNGGTNTITIPSFTSTERDAMSATNGMLIYNTTLAALQRREAGAWASFSGGGTVTSVAVTSSDLTIGGSPITTSGTITISLPSNLIGWNSISTNHLTSTNNFLTFSNSLLSIYQTGSANLTNWSGTATNLWTTLSQFSNFTNGLPVGLPASGATAGSYTLASITVDAYGRVTAASSGTSVTLNGLTTIPSTGGVAVNVAAAPATNVVDLTVASATNILNAALTILHATNGATASERTHVRWFWTDGTTRALTIPSGWKTNVNSAVPASITNGTITRMFVTSIGDTSSSSNQTNVFVSFEFYK